MFPFTDNTNPEVQLRDYTVRPVQLAYLPFTGRDNPCLVESCREGQIYDPFLASPAHLFTISHHPIRQEYVPDAR